MRIAQVAPLYESVPPSLYGGTERVVSYLTEELVAQGHDVTLFASGDSVTAARLVAACPRALRLDESCIDQLAHHVLLLERVHESLAAFDVVHYHIDYLHFPLTRRAPHPHLTTLHGRLDIPDLVPLYDRFGDMPIVSISDDQRTPLPHLCWQSTVYHGLPEHLYRFNERPEGYLAFIGRISPEKRVDRAIAIARAAGMPLRIAAKVDRVDRDYFRERIEPLLDDPLIDWVGEIGDADKDAFLGNAAALLFPIDWPEPFGLVMIEAMACGTPVIACRRGSVPEVIDEGRSGVLIDADLDPDAGPEAAAEGVAAVERALAIDRRACRECFDRRFTAQRMALDYVDLYQRLIMRGGWMPPMSRAGLERVAS